MTRFLIPLVALFALLAFLGVGLQLKPREIPSPLVDKQAPTFSLPRLYQADALISDKDLLGKVTLFNVWASWCVACRAEHPLLVELSKTTDINIIGLNYKDERADAQRWLSQFGNPYSVSAHDLDGRVGIEWGVYGVPETFVVDSAGVIRYKHIGPLSKRDLEETILPMIKKLQVNEAS